MTQEDEKSWVVVFVSFAITAMLSPSLIQCAKSQNDKASAEYESREYLIEIVDKYDHLGSSWHLIGGRSTEQEYHIIYKATPLTEEAKKNFYYTGEHDEEVSYKTYRKYKVGDTYKSHEFLYIK